MDVANERNGTTIGEIADGIYRINTPIVLDEAGQFSFNQYLVLADQPLLFHTGPRQLFPQIRDAVDRVIAVDRLRHISFSHFEADECGSLNEWLDVAPDAHPLCSSIAAMVSIRDIADRAPRGMVDGETLDLGGKTVRWLDAPHVPHGWDCGFLFEEQTRTLFCGDLFTQPGSGSVLLTEGDIFTPSEAFRDAMDYFSHAPDTVAILEKLAATNPETLACMHGSAWRGDGGQLIRRLAANFAA